MTEEEKINQEETVVNDSVVDTKEAVAEEETVNEAPAEEPTEEKDPLEAALKEIEQLKTQMLYKTAEFDNYRKRTLKEKAELILNGGEKAVSAVLPVIDDMERAIENGAKTDDPEVLREGMELIYNKFIKALEGLGVKKIDTADADFDTDLHEAVAMVPGMGDDKKGKVIDCLQTGYMLNDKVIRHAKVAVGQ
jgi:molecular chaperone GrpE